MGSSSSSATYPRTRRDRLLAKQVCCCCGVAHRALELAGNVIVGQHVFVDGTYGNDATGLRERLDRPFQTVIAGLNAVHSGDTLAIQPGTYPTAPISLPAVDALSAPLAVLTIQGWGSANNVILSNEDGPVFQNTTGTPAQQDWTFENLTVSASLNSFAFRIGDDSVARFGGSNGLVIRNVVASATRFVNVTRMSINECEFDATGIVSCGDVQVVDTDFLGILSTSYADPTNPPPVAPRVGYYFANIWASQSVAMDGPLAVAFDSACRVSNINAVIAPIPTPPLNLNPVVRFAGTLGGSNNHDTTSDAAPGDAGADFDFGDTAWATASGNEMNGVDLSGMRCYGQVSFTFGFALADMQDSSQFFFGGDNCTILGSLIVNGVGGDEDTLDYVRFRHTAFSPGAFSSFNGPNAPGVFSTNAIIDLRGSYFGDNNNLFIDVTGFGGVDRDQENFGAFALSNLAPVANVISFPAIKFPAYATLFPIVTVNDSGALTTTGATVPDNQTVNVFATAATTADVMVRRYSSSAEVT